MRDKRFHSNEDIGEASAKVDMLIRSFFNRTDIIGCMAPWGTPCPAVPIGSLANILHSHVTGEKPNHELLELRTRLKPVPFIGPYRVGSYAPGVDGLTKWICIDIDGPGHATAVEDPLGMTIQIKKILDGWAKPYVEISGGGHGWHLWAFFAEPVSAQSVREFVLSALPNSIRLANGNIVPIHSNKGVEVFPKRGSVINNGVGGMVWLPYWHGAKGDANQFVQLNDDRSYSVINPRDICFELVEALPDEYRLLQPKKPTSVRSGCKVRCADWKSWRIEALSRFDREIPYGKYLTGSTRGSYWECRDPFAESGDNDPSAGVSMGGNGTELLSFHTFIGGRSMSVFDFLVETRKDIKRHEDAVKFVSYHSGVGLP